MGINQRNKQGRSLNLTHYDRTMKYHPRSLTEACTVDSGDQEAHFSTYTHMKRKWRKSPTTPLNKKTIVISEGSQLPTPPHNTPPMSLPLTHTHPHTFPQIPPPSVLHHAIPHPLPL